MASPLFYLAESSCFDLLGLRLRFDDDEEAPVCESAVRSSPPTSSAAAAAAAAAAARRSARPLLDDDDAAGDGDDAWASAWASACESLRADADDADDERWWGSDAVVLVCDDAGSVWAVVVVRPLRKACCCCALADDRLLKAVDNGMPVGSWNGLPRPPKPVPKHKANARASVSLLFSGFYLVLLGFNSVDCLHPKRVTTWSRLELELLKQQESKHLASLFFCF